MFKSILSAAIALRIRIFIYYVILLDAIFYIDANEPTSIYGSFKQRRGLPCCYLYLLESVRYGDAVVYEKHFIQSWFSGLSALLQNAKWIDCR